MPALLSSLINAPAGELSRVLAADGSRCCLREWPARVPDPRSRPGRWHPLMFVLAVAVCAFTAAGHDSPAAIAEWAAGCSQATLAAMGGRRDPWAGRIRPPGARTFSRVFGRIDAEAFNVAVCGYLACAGRKLGYGLGLDFDAAMIGARVREDGLPAAGDRGVVARVAGEVLLVQGRRNTRAPARGRGTAADGSPASPVLD